MGEFIGNDRERFSLLAEVHRGANSTSDLASQVLDGLIFACCPRERARFALWKNRNVGPKRGVGRGGVRALLGKEAGAKRGARKIGAAQQPSNCDSLVDLLYVPCDRIVPDLGDPRAVIVTW